MKTSLSVFFILISLTLSDCQQNGIRDQQFTLLGKIGDQDTGSLILQYGFGSAFHSDTTKVVNGGFSFKGIVTEPTRAVLQGDNKSGRIDLYLEPGGMKMTLTKNNFKNFILSGSKSQEELNKLNKLLKSGNNKDSILLHFTINNPKSYLAPYYLQSLGSRKVISVDSLKSIFYGLNPSVQNSRYGRYTNGVIRNVENTTAGNYASDFKAIDLNNNLLTLSQFKSKNIVILDFWASWCVPCREAFPHLRTLFNKYHSRGLEIIGIASFDKNRQTWEAAINEDSIKMWHHLATVFRNGETVNEEVALDYPMGPVPCTILIDKNGKIIGCWTGYSKENEKSLDNELKKIFEE